MDLDNREFPVSEIFNACPGKLQQSRKLAGEISCLIDELSPLILRHTEMVCPLCKDVCCINRHSSYAYDDFIYLSALGERMVERKEGIGDREPCQFLGLKGCTISHSRRPYRCTWYFCSQLLHEIGRNSAREYRRFSSLLRSITEKRKLLFREFEEAYERISAVNVKRPACFDPAFSERIVISPTSAIERDLT